MLTSWNGIGEMVKDTKYNLILSVCAVYNKRVSTFSHKVTLNSITKCFRSLTINDLLNYPFLSLVSVQTPDCL